VKESLKRIVTYQDTETAKEADERLRERIGERLDYFLGLVEWLKTDQVKKGAYRLVEDLESLSLSIEGMSRKTEAGWDHGGRLFEQREANPEGLTALSEHHRVISEALSRLEEDLLTMTRTRAVPQAPDIQNVQGLLEKMKEGIEGRATLVRALEG